MLYSYVIYCLMLMFMYYVYVHLLIAYVNICGEVFYIEYMIYHRLACAFGAFYINNLSDISYMVAR